MRVLLPGDTLGMLNHNWPQSFVVETLRRYRPELESRHANILKQDPRLLFDQERISTWMLPIPATFVIGSDGLVNARWIDPDYRRRADLDEILEAVRRSRQAVHPRFQARTPLG